jgi:hypothetical protein
MYVPAFVFPYHLLPAQWYTFAEVLTHTWPGAGVEDLVMVGCAAAVEVVFGEAGAGLTAAAGTWLFVATVVLPVTGVVVPTTAAPAGADAPQLATPW